MADPVQTDIRVLVPRVRRKLEGAGAPAVLTDDAIKDITADAIASIILYTGSLFGKTLIVTADDNGIPTEYATSDVLTLMEGEIVAAQAALDYFFFAFSGLKTSERIADEAGTWEYSISASLLKAQLDLLVKERDRALDTLLDDSGTMDEYTSFIAIRDQTTSLLIEPWVTGRGGNGGLDRDYRFGY